MHHFAYRGGVLHAEDVDLVALADAVGTPTYVYSTATIVRHARVFREAFRGRDIGMFYAMKANGNLSVLRTLAREGVGADTVSEGEIRKALAAGVPASGVVFSGVGKTDAELAFAVEAGIHQINVETESELVRLNRIASARGVRQDIVFRVNPDVGAGGHAKITTGGEGNKFGVSFADVHRLYAVAETMPGVRPLGLAVHIGSLIDDLGPLEEAFLKLRDLTIELRAGGRTVERLDFGGGIGIPYAQDPAVTTGPDLVHAYADMVLRVVDGLDVEIAFEPGRMIIGNAGIMLTRVVATNPRPSKTFLVVDAAMNDLVRPAMYEAYHEIWPVKESGAATPTHAYDVVGPVCESSDTFATDRAMPEVAEGELVAFMTAGAYGAAMSSTYNQRQLVAEVLVDGARWALVRPRQTFEELIALDRVAPWLGN